MKINKIKIRNFLGIGEGEIDFNKRGLVLIEGVNHDSPTSLSNGAGKSSIFEALFWGLYGKTKRGLSGDDVINRQGSGGCAVEIWFDGYRLIRTRKYSSLNTGLWLYQACFDDDAFFVGEEDLTRGTVKETQELLEGIIKLSELTFSKVAYFGQEDVKAFANLSDAELKRVFEQALGVSYIAGYLERVKGYKAGKAVALRELQASIAEMGNQSAILEERLITLNNASVELARKHSEEIETVERQLAESTDEIARLSEAIKSLDESIAKYSEKATADIEKLKRLEGLRGQMAAKVKNAQDDVGFKRGVIAHKKDVLKSLEVSVRGAGDLIGKQCDRCKRPFTEADARAAISAYEAEIGGLKKVLEEFEGALSLSGENHKKLSVLHERLEDEIRALSLAKTVVKELETRAAWRQDRLMSLNREKARRAELMEIYCALSKGFKNPYASQIETAKYSLSANEENIKRAKAQATDFDKDIAVAEKLEGILGNGGLKSYIFDNITPELNREVNKYAQMLDDLEIEISTVKKLKSGEYRERFSISVTNKHGADIYDGNSGGEKQKINLAVALGFNRVLRGCSEAGVNVCFLDEPFEALDEGSSESVIDLCREFAGADGIYIITHQQSIKDLIPNVIRVEKRHGQAKII
jgi:DNA repair exonuclease SbcCD ATPase subunit